MQPGNTVRPRGRCIYTLGFEEADQILTSFSSSFYLFCFHCFIYLFFLSCDFIRVLLFQHQQVSSLGGN